MNEFLCLYDMFPSGRELQFTSKNMAFDKKGTKIELHFTGIVNAIIGINQHLFHQWLYRYHLQYKIYYGGQISAQAFQAIHLVIIGNE